jgi:hypothetical protein
MAEEVIPFLFGWKLAEIIRVDNHLEVRSGTVGVRVGVDAAAHCLKHPEHDAPVRHCSCGFFALERAEALVLYARYPYSQLLEVELSGRTITGRSGMRSQYQRMLRMLLMPVCAQCGSSATVLGERDPGRRTQQIFAEPTLAAWCERCVGARWWLPDEVGSELGVEVSWAVPTEALVLHGLGMFPGDH